MKPTICLAIARRPAGTFLPSSERLSFKRKYAGKFQYISACEGITSVTKVQARLGPKEEGLEEDEIFRRHGNEYADTAAQQGALSRPRA